MGDELLPLLPAWEDIPASQQPSSLSQQDYDMQDTAMAVVGDQQQDLGASTPVVTPGVKGQSSTLPLAGGGPSSPVQDAVMLATAPGAGEQSPASLGLADTPEPSSSVHDN